jgi:lathosterol oxidase
MDTIDLSIIWKVFAITTLIGTARYIFFAGITFLLFWVIWKKKYQHRWIQQDKTPDKKKIFHEIKYSLITMVIFGCVGILTFTMRKAGWTMIYTDISEYGWGYFFLSLAALILLHDTYFYWAHRWMHHPKIFKYVHQTHHVPTNPSPWAAFAFHPLESILEAGIVPLAILLFPLHLITILVFLLYMTFLNVLGHLAFEMFPKNFLRNPILKWHNTSTHHNMHHKYFNCNYGLYFNWWDTWMGTNHKDYKKNFEEITNRKPATAE